MANTPGQIRRFDAVIGGEISNSEEEDHGHSKIKRKILRDHSNPLDFPDSVFVAQYRLDKEAFVMVLEIIKPHMPSSTIPAMLQFAATLRFLAEGSFQRSVGNDASISLGRSTVSEVLTNNLKLLQKYVCPQYVKLTMDDSEKQAARAYFYNKYKIPGVIGCIDGTHIKIIKPVNDEHLFFNRKGYFSLNAMIICDNSMIIRAIDARYPGSSHDAFIWNISTARNHFLRQHRYGDRTSRLLGDSGYGIEPFLLTPYRDAPVNTQKHKFNMAHAAARNIVERTIGVLKSRFRCLQSTLHYSPEKVVQMINVCCTLHNICRMRKIEWNYTDNIITMPQSNDDVSDTINTLQNEGQRMRDEIAATL